MKELDSEYKLYKKPLIKSDMALHRQEVIKHGIGLLQSEGTQIVYREDESKALLIVSLQSEIAELKITIESLKLQIAEYLA